MKNDWIRKICADGYYFERAWSGEGLNYGQKFLYATEFNHGISVVYDHNLADKWAVIDSHGKLMNGTKACIWYKFGNKLQYAVVWNKCLGFNIVAYGKGFIFNEFVDDIKKIELTDTNAVQIKRIRKIGTCTSSIVCSFEYNIFTVDGKMAFKEWVKSIEITKSNFIKITEFDGTFSIYDKNFNLLLSKLTYFVPLLNYYYYEIGTKIDSEKLKYNVIDEYGELISDEWFDSITDPTDFAMIVKKGNKQNLLSYSGDIIQKEWFDNIKVTTNAMIEKFPWCGLFGKYRVWKDDKQNFLTNKGELLSSLWADEIVYQKNECVFLNNEKGQFSIKFNLDE